MIIYKYTSTHKCFKTLINKVIPANKNLKREIKNKKMRSKNVVKKVSTWIWNAKINLKILNYWRLKKNTKDIYLKEVLDLYNNGIETEANTSALN